MLVAFYKPYGVLTRFTPDGSPNRTLKEFSLPPRVHPIGRIDADSEGLLLLSDEKHWEDKLLNPRRSHWRTYWAQVEGIPDESALGKLRAGGVLIGDYSTRPARAGLLTPAPVVTGREDDPIIHAPGQIALPARVPAIRYRKNIPDTWIELSLTEGKNRQVRRMTAAVGHPTLRLIRFAIGELNLAGLALRPGESKLLGAGDEKLLTRS
ncbi:pseudouridine synthase [Oscillatoria laete-virens NRMC-F 0139]|nr:pseudouridine synthase [Oscillatoria laete-virens]MDL5054675.1 pseudouridine synthase [Oscillatoria laete-virens NRMC-F 0139]